MTLTLPSQDHPLHQLTGTANDWKHDLSLAELNEIFTPLTYRERIEALYTFFDEARVLYTSSFGTKSAFLLHEISRIRPTQRVHFIDTTYHFPETIAYRDELAERFGLNLTIVSPSDRENAMTREEKWWLDHPRMCCSINKVVPLEPIVAQHDVWISGLMAYQTDFRKDLSVFTQQGDIIKFHPIIDIDEGEFLFHMEQHDLPRHPLQAKGYGSIGCSHCTQPGEGRSGRWVGTQNKECGLHPNYFINRIDK